MLDKFGLNQPVTYRVPRVHFEKKKKFRPILICSSICSPLEKASFSTFACAFARKMLEFDLPHLIEWLRWV